MATKQRARTADRKPSRYEKLTKQFPLRPIEDDEMNDRAAELCDKLTDRLDDLTKDESDYLEVISMLIEQYESKWNDDIIEMSPQDLIRAIMDRNALNQKDLIPEFGAESRVSDFLNGKRQLSKEQALALAKRFALRLDALIR